MSHYGDYIKEKECKEIIEDHRGFAAFRVFPELKQLWIADFYLAPEHRKSMIGYSLFTDLEKVCQERDLNEMVCQVFTKSMNPEQSLMAVLKLGFKIMHIQDNHIIYLSRQVKGGSDGR